MIKSIVAGYSKTARIALYGSAAIIGLAIPSVAFAQTASATGPVPSTDRTASDEQTGNDIIVTATKRERTLQDTPVAVSVTTADTIERAQIRDLKDLQTLVPSLRVSQLQSSANTNFIIRGFGNGANNAGIEPAVGVFVDGVYRSRTLAQVTDLPDIQRVEVLRGPQSTLFGKNASAGVISMVTKSPQFKFGGNVEATYGNYNAVVLKGVVTGPITDTIAASFAAGYNRRDGYIRDLGPAGGKTNNRNRYFLRGQLLFEPNDSFKFRVIGDYDNINEICCGVVNVKSGAATPAVLAVGGHFTDPAKPFQDVVYNNFPSTNEIKNYGVSGQADFKFGSLTLTSITAYREAKSHTNQDSDFTDADILNRNEGHQSIKTFTQELRLTSDLEGPINFLLGGFFFHENIKTDNALTFGKSLRPYVNLLTANGVTILETAILGVPSQTYFQPGQGQFTNNFLRNTAYSTFGQVDFNPTDRLTLTAGVNYTHDAKTFGLNVVSTDGFAALPLPAIVAGAINANVALTVGSLLGNKTGVPASAAQLAFFQSAAPGSYAAVVGGVSAQINPLLGLQAIQVFKPFVNVPNSVEPGKTRDSKFTYTLRANYKVTDHLSTYISYATGFKASSINLSGDSRPFPADAAALTAAGLVPTNLSYGSRFAGPENSTVYELGLKGNWGVASFNFAAFKEIIKGFQDNAFVGTGFVLTNAGKESVTGLEFEGSVHPIRELTFNLAMTYLVPKLDSFVGSVLGDISGSKPAGIPAISSTFGMQYDQPLSNDDHVILRADYHYESPVQIAAGITDYIVTTNGVKNYQPARDVARPYRRTTDELSASFTYAMHMGLELSVWGRNILNSRTLTTIFPGVFQSGVISGYTNQPRTYGASARFRF